MRGADSKNNSFLLFGPLCARLTMPTASSLTPRARLGVAFFFFGSRSHCGARGRNGRVWHCRTLFGRSSVLHGNGGGESAVAGPGLTRSRPRARCRAAKVPRLAQHPATPLLRVRRCEGLMRDFPSFLSVGAR